MYNLKDGQVARITPLSGTVSDRLGHAKINLPTKFEVPNFTRYGNITYVAKCRKLGGLRWLGVTQPYQQCHYSIERIQLPIRL